MKEDIRDNTGGKWGVRGENKVEKLQAQHDILGYMHGVRSLYVMDVIDARRAMVVREWLLRLQR